MFVARIKPKTERQSHAKNLERCLMRRDQWHKWIVMPLHKAHYDHRHYRYEDEDLKRCRKLTDQLNAANVDPCNRGDQRQGNKVMLPSCDSREVIHQIIGEENGVASAEQNRRHHMPPPHYKT